MPLCLLLASALMLLSRNRSRLSRDAANLRISRDRANVDLQMITQRMQSACTQADDCGSLPGSLPARKLASLTGAPATSLPPGPPSSTDTDTSGPPSSSSGRSGMLNAPLRATTVSVPPKRPAPPTPQISAPPLKKAPNLYFAFCREQRPRLPPALTNGERERCLSLRWKDLSVAEKAMYRVQGGGGTLAPVPAPTVAPTMTNVASTSRQATSEAISSTDRWNVLWKVREAKASCRVASSGTSSVATQHAPPPALVVPSSTPAAPVFAASHHLVAPSSFLAPPNHLPPPNPSTASTGMDVELAEVLEHMTEEEALEALGAEMLRGR